MTDSRRARPEGHDGAGQLPRVGVVAVDVDEVAGDLERRHREPLEVAQRRVAGAEVVDRDADPGVAQVLQLRAGRGAVLEHRRLGHLEDDLGRVDAGLPDDRQDLVDEVGLGQLPGRDVDADRERVRRRRGSCQARTWRQAWPSTQRPISRIESDSSATRMKSSGPIRPRSGCSQRTSASTPTIRPRRDLDDRLVLEDELAGRRWRAPGRPTAGHGPSPRRASTARRRRPGPCPGPSPSTSRRRRCAAGRRPCRGPAGPRPRRRWPGR